MTNQAIVVRVLGQVAWLQWHFHSAKIGCLYELCGLQSECISWKRQPSSEVAPWNATSSAMTFLPHWVDAICACFSAQPGLIQLSLAQPGMSQPSTAQLTPAQPSPTQPSPAQHSTAQHSTAQHSTAQHSRAQHSTAGQGLAEHAPVSRDQAARRLPKVTSSTSLSPMWLLPRFRTCMPSECFYDCVGTLVNRILLQ